ncbi:hypothetical protein D5R81_15740 [Parashewanella spongiae]|uniref:Uncharacterized protein n=1 Tax=Parashewanella spongiae TaxID=342950 RepID=A0A3A6TG52_9GAMM|nr:hypothetical protein [Parashewanella spongiae]MCL1080028.1 hypothetical protein [Parashewanella spongiae]RJY07454.1 hypothetical protein D5R81_15740 [Parashewanella spongiae]
MLLCFSLETLACNKETQEFSPFAVEFEGQDNLQQEFKTFEILSPINKGDEFLSSITARLKGEFEINLDVREDINYIGDYYYSFINISEKNIDNIEIILSYNTTKKDRSDMLFCANWKIYKLSKLLSFVTAQEAPLLHRQDN